MASSTKVRLGDLDVEIPRLTLGQLERVADWLAEAPTDGNLKSTVTHNRKLLAIGTERSPTPYTDEQLGALEMTVTDLRDAVTAILEIAGLVMRGETVGPEAPAPNGASATSLTSSLESSAPAAGMPLQ